MNYILLKLFVLMLLGLYYVVIGARVVLTKKQLVINNIWSRCVLIASIIIILTSQNFMPHNLQLLLGVIWLCILVMIWRNTKGYRIYGIANPALRDSIIATLQEMNIAFEENMTGITISSENIKLEAMAMTNGISTIRVQNEAHTDWLKKFADNLSAHYRRHTVPLTLTYSYFLCLLGLVLVGVILWPFIH